VHITVLKQSAKRANMQARFCFTTQSSRLPAIHVWGLRLWCEPEENDDSVAAAASAWRTSKDKYNSRDSSSDAGMEEDSLRTQCKWFLYLSLAEFCLDIVDKGVISPSMFSFLQSGLKQRNVVNVLLHI